MRSKYPTLTYIIPIARVHVQPAWSFKSKPFEYILWISHCRALDIFHFRIRINCSQMSLKFPSISIASYTQTLWALPQSHRSTPPRTSWKCSTNCLPASTDSPKSTSSCGLRSWATVITVLRVPRWRPRITVPYVFTWVSRWWRQSSE